MALEPLIDGQGRPFVRGALFHPATIENAECCCPGQACWYVVSACLCSGVGVRYVVCDEAEAHPDWPGPIIWADADDICWFISDQTPTTDTLPPGAVVVSIGTELYADCQECCDAQVGCWREVLACGCDGGTNPTNLWVPCEIAPPPGDIWIWFEPSVGCVYINDDSAAVSQLPPGGIETVAFDNFTSCPECCGTPCDGCEDNCGGCPDSLTLRVHNWVILGGPGSGCQNATGFDCCQAIDPMTIVATKPTGSVGCSYPTLAPIYCEVQPNGEPGAPDQRQIPPCVNGCCMWLQQWTMTCTGQTWNIILTIAHPSVQDAITCPFGWQGAGIWEVPIDTNLGCPCPAPGMYVAVGQSGDLVNLPVLEVVG